MHNMLEEIVQSLPDNEIVAFKSSEVAKLDLTGTFESGEWTIEIQSTEEVTDKGVAALVRAWRNGQPVGFGADGTIEIERIRVMNPPLLVDDPNGSITREYDDGDGNICTRTLREDPRQAFFDTVLGTVKLVGMDGANIIPGKVGKTTDVFYPSPGTTVDGWVRRTVAGQTWAQIHDGAGNSNSSTDTSERFCLISSDGANSYDDLTRSIFLFDTSSLPDTDTITSATFSVVGTGKLNTNGISTANAAGEVCGTTPAANASIANSDYANFGTTSFGSIAYASFDTGGSAYNDIALNASGIAAVDKTGITKLGMRSHADITNTAPGATGAGVTRLVGVYSDTTGTASDPKLTVVHSAAAAPTGPGFFLNFV